MKADDFSHSVNMRPREEMHKSYAKPARPEVITIFPYAQRKPLVSLNVSIPSAIFIMEAIYYALVDLGEISAPKKEAKQNSTESHSFLPVPPHPFVFAMDALFTDDALSMETRGRIAAAIGYFNEVNKL